MASRFALWLAATIALVACNAYDRGVYNRLVDGGDATLQTDALSERNDTNVVDGDSMAIDAPPPDTTDAPMTCASCGAGEMCCGGTCANVTQDPANCGACGDICPGTTCSGGTCTGVCVIGRLDCDRNVVNGCEIDAASDPMNCGACGHACGPSRACTDGMCVCPAGRADCDGDPANGCEVQLDSDTANCGACGRACGANQACGATGCGCATGFADCDADPMNGCESDTRSDPTHCGTCTTSCGANAHCTAGVCGCDTGWLQCGSGISGCPVSSNDPNNCGSCGVTCPATAPVCDMGMCSVMCATGQTRCDTVCADTNTDPMHCGTCTTTCPVPANASATCNSGMCGFTCDSGFADCNGMASDGCEVNIATSTTNCGTCGTRCTSSQICAGGACACPAGQRDCGSGRCAACCVNADCNDGNGCTTDTCSSTGTCSHSSCGSGTVCCGMTACNQCCTDADCSSLPGNRGCGTDGRCSTCAAGYADCDGNATNGCEANLATSVTDCGTCGRACSYAHAAASCSSGTCRLDTCDPNWGDCDHVAANGCEADLQNSSTYCGRCNRSCSGGQVCSAGTCVTATCPSGFGNCNGTLTDGCEANFNTDPAHCGSCTTACTFTNASATCSSGTCVIGACTAGFGNCDGNALNGCETTLATSTANCGSCGRVCSFAFASASCSAGACVLGTCSSGHANCDGVSTNGCEVDLNTSTTNCGACGAPCTARANATTSCSAGTCAYMCNAGFGDCDGVPTNGCEASLASTSNCGACGRVCAAGLVCSGGTCTMATLTGPEFRVDTLTPTECFWRDTTYIAGDDRGGIAVSPTQVLYTGDTATGLWNASTLDPGASAGRVHGSMLQDIGDGTIYALLDAAGNEVASTSLTTPITLTQLGVINGSTGALTTTRIPLSMSIAVSQGSGIFSGWNRAVIWNGTRVYHIDLPAGTVTDLGAMTFPTHIACESWAFWGVAEFYGGALYVDYTASTTTIARTAVPSGTTTTLGTFTGLGDICSFTFSPTRNRWYWHAEVAAQFSSGGSEATGYCAGTWSVPSGMCPAGYTLCSGGCHVFANDDLNCGACARACTTSQRCVAGTCSTACTGGQVSCSGVCAAVLSDESNCSTCGNVCAFGANSTALCGTTGCTLSCTTGYGNCNGLASDGCEVALNTVTNCRSCGLTCTAPTGATVACTTAGCTVTCPAGQLYCGTTCVTVNTTTNCGACGRTCATGQSCIAGACVPTSCPAGSGYADCNAMSADGCEINTNTDPLHCGSCLTACATGQACVNGTCMACHTTAPRILVWGPTIDTYTTMAFPTGSTITTADDAMWRSMTATNFASYDLIVIDSGSSTQYQAIFDTRDIWSPVVNGRIVVTGSDAGVHSAAGSMLFLQNTMRWLTTGPGTALYVASDINSRMLDFMQSIAPLGSVSASSNDVTLMAPSHPVMAGETSASLSTWNTTIHSAVTTMPGTWTVLADVATNHAQHAFISRDLLCR